MTRWIGKYDSDTHVVQLHILRYSSPSAGLTAHTTQPQVYTVKAQPSWSKWPSPTCNYMLLTSNSVNDGLCLWKEISMETHAILVLTATSLLWSKDEQINIDVFIDKNDNDWDSLINLES